MVRIEIEATAWGYHVKVAGDDDEAFYFAIGYLKEVVPAGCRHYDPGRRRWFVAARAGRALDAWLAALEEVYPLDLDDRRRPRPADPDDPGFPDPLGDAYKTLHLRASAPLCLVRAARRALACLHHPDVGGDPEQIKRINAAADQIEQRLTGAAG